MKITMKKLLALVLAVVLSLGLASVAFADIYAGGQMTNIAEKDTNSGYHKLPNSFSESDTIKLWACFDGEAQTAEFIFVPENTVPTDEVVPDFLTVDGKALAFSPEAKWAYKYTANSEYVNKLVIAPITVDAQDEANLGKYYVTGFEITIVPNDHVIAENKTVKGYFYAWDNNALTTQYIWACNFEIELRNHYIDVEAINPITKTYYENNASFGGKYSEGWNDLLNVYLAGKNLILHRHYGQANTSEEPSYVVYDEQFKESTQLILKATTFEYTGLVTVKIADTYGQDGINFKYGEGKFAPSVAQLYANPDLAGYYFNFLSKETVESATEVVFNKANVAQYVGDTAYIYYSVDGKTYEALGTVDMKDAKAEVKVNLEAGDVLGYYLFLNSALEVAEEDTGKDNVGTGASDMTSVCVALAVVSLVAAGAVCVKKVSK